MKELTADNVNTIFRKCLFKDEEVPDNSNLPAYVRADGIMTIVGLHPERLKIHEQDIKDMLSQLPDEFQEKKGGGWSFLNACNNNKGEQWADLHQTMEQLFQLGVGVGMVRCVVPRTMWDSLPGGMPYYVVLAEQENGGIRVTNPSVDPKG